LIGEARRRARDVANVALLAVSIAGAGAAAFAAPLSNGANPDPIRLVRPPRAPLSAMARLGQRVFFDRTLSSSGRLSCAQCHSPQRMYGPPNDLPVMDGGPKLASQGVRAVPSLMYLERSPGFSVGADTGEAPDGASTPSPQPIDPARAQKTVANTSASAVNLVPQGGLFWDGRADTLQSQARSPLLNPLEMDGGSITQVAVKLRRAPYAELFAQLFGPGVFANPRVLVSEALFAVGR
jgi:cytochrome c peroxidase